MLFSLISLLSYFCDRETCVFKSSGRLLFSLLIINKYYTPKMLLLRSLQKLLKRILFKLLFFCLFSKLYKTSTDGCFLVYVLLVIV